MFANKRLAVAFSKSRAHEDDLQNDIAKWVLKKATAKDRETALEKLKRNRAMAEKLFGKTNGCGMIIGEIVTGDVATYEGLLGVPVLEFKLWPESEWIKSPGGLGVRHMPWVKRE